MSIDTSIKEISDLNALDNSSVVIGLLVGIDKQATPVISYPFIPHCNPQPANTTVLLNESDIGRQVAILFAQGDQKKPLIIGKLFNPKIDQVITAKDKLQDHNIEIYSDQQHTEIVAKNKIKLTCGKSSVTLTQEGKILIEGEYILSQSTGPNKIKGASIQLN